MSHAPEPTIREQRHTWLTWNRVLITSLVVIIALGGVFLGGVWLATQNLADNYEGVRQDKAVLCSEEANRDAPECEKDDPPAGELVPADPPVPIPGRTGARGPRGPQGPGPSPASVLRAVRAIIEPIVISAVADYLRSNPPPAGEKGDKGDPGEPGAPSTVPGPAGATGPAGRDGQDAPRITAIDCSGLTPLSITFTYSDGSSQTVECEYLPPVEEPQEPEEP